jgi:hypothetical protein
MLYFRYLVPAIFAAAAVSGSIAYFIMPSVQTAARVRLLSERSMAFPTPISAERQHNEASDEAKAAADFLRAAQEILKRAPNSQAALTGRDNVPIAGRVPLPKRRPIPR